MAYRSVETLVNKPAIRDNRDLSNDALNDVERFFPAYNRSLLGRAGARDAEAVLSRDCDRLDLQRGTGSPSESFELEHPASED